MNIAFLDFDGTITTGDGYRLGWVPAARMCASIAWFAGQAAP